MRLQCVVFDAFKQPSQISKSYAFLKALTESRSPEKRAYTQSGGKTASEMSRVVSSHPVTFDRLRSTRLNVVSATLGANLVSPEGLIERTVCDGKALKGNDLVAVREVQNHDGKMC
jgi:hypothetical protein